MKRYLIFAALGPLLGGFLLLFATTYMSGYWTHTDLFEEQGPPPAGSRPDRLRGWSCKPQRIHHRCMPAGNRSVRRSI